MFLHYGIETACDKHGWILGYSIHPGNEHDSRTFKTLYDKLLSYHPEKMVLDAGYKTPAIAHLLIEDQIEPLFPYKCPQTKKGFFKKYEYVYDEYYDLRKETIERIFGTAKEQHGFRYTQYKGKARMEMKVGLTYACMNLKKLAKKGAESIGYVAFFNKNNEKNSSIQKSAAGVQLQQQLCLQSEVYPELA